MKTSKNLAPVRWLFVLTLLLGGFMGLRAQEKNQSTEPVAKVKIIKIINGDTTIIEKEGHPMHLKFDHPEHPRHPHPPRHPHHIEHHIERQMMCMPDSMHQGKKCKQIIFVYENGDSSKVDCQKMCPKMEGLPRSPHHEMIWEEKEIIIEKDKGKGKSKNHKKPVKADIKMNLDVFPNPTKGIVNLDVVTTEKELDLKVLDVSGKEVMTKVYNIDEHLQTQIDLSGLAKGIYTLVLRTPAQLEVVKIQLD